MSTAVWLIVGFLAGVAVGATWRESYEILIGRHQPMTLLRRAAHTVTTPRLAIALLLSLVLNMTVGVLVIVNDANYRGTVDCNVEYNRLTGEARDSRNVAVDEASKAQLEYVEQDLAYQRGLLRTVTSDAGTVDELAGVIRKRVDAAEAYRDSLKEQEQVRAENEYPAPDYCTRER